MRWWDVEQVAGIEATVFADEAAWSVEQLWAELAGVPDRRRYVVAEAAQSVVGYAGISLGVDTADVMTVAVHPGWRGTGVGRRLVTALLDDADEHGAREVLLEVRATNVAAIALYADLGFVTISRRRHYYGPGRDGVIMARRAQ
ncbi:MAG: ribosomal protein S18-alanine N-acetyltransferase [Jiangellales bacterium]